MLKLSDEYYMERNATEFMYFKRSRYMLRLNCLMYLMSMCWMIQ
jgi:hypothetical protein